MRLASPASVELGGGISSSPPIHSVQGFGTRSVRASTRDATAQSIAIQRRNDERLCAKRASDTAKQKLAQSIPEAVPEEEAGDDAPYTTFTGSPASAWGSSVQGTPSVNADDMEATVAALVYESAAESVVSDMTKLTEWMDYSGGAIDGARKLSKGKFVCDATSAQISNIISNGGISKSTQSVLLAIRDSLSVQLGFFAG